MNMSYLVEVMACENATLYFDFQELLYAVQDGGTVRYLKSFEEPHVVFRQGQKPHLALTRSQSSTVELWPRGTKGFVLPLPEIKAAVPL
jgi:hypothetical protein